MYEFVPIYNAEGESFEKLVVKIINTKLKNELELDLSDTNDIKYLTDR